MIRDTYAFAFVQGLWERLRLGDAFGRTHETDQGWSEAYMATEFLAPETPPLKTDLGEAYEVVGEMLEYFDSYRLATWAPLAAVILRERRRARGEQA
jgi:hypothetical protein